MQRLETKVKTGVSNTSLITQEVLELSLKEAEEIKANKNISTALFLDIAYVRALLMLKKEGLDELELEFYNGCLKSLKESPFFKEEIKDSTDLTNFAQVKERESKWD